MVEILFRQLAGVLGLVRGVFLNCDRCRESARNYMKIDVLCRSGMPYLCGPH